MRSLLSKIIVSWTSWSCIQALWRGSRKAFPDEVSGFSAPKRTRTWHRVECSRTLGIRINISADLSEFLYPPRRKILPLLQSGAISYSLPGFRYAPPWANVYRHSVARIHCKGVIETFIPVCNSDRLLQNLFWTPVGAGKVASPPSLRYGATLLGSRTRRSSKSGGGPRRPPTEVGFQPCSNCPLLLV
jgi:hypothetical protein